jgi:hypothetical protein
LEILNESANYYVNAFGEKHGFLQTKVIGEDKESGFLNVQLPGGTTTLMSKGSYDSARKSELDRLETKFWANGENVPREFVGKHDEYIAFMAALRTARVTGNELNFGNAQNEGFGNMGAPVEYVEINNKGQAVKKTYTYEVGNVRELNYATPAQVSAKVQKDLYNAIGANNTDIGTFERASNVNSLRDVNGLGDLWDWVVSGVRDWYFKDLEERAAKGLPISPADYTQLERFRNAKARLEYLANDGMQMGSLRPEGQDDRNIPGEASVLAGRAVRQSTTGIAQWQTELESIRAQLGRLMYHGILEGNITVQGTIKAEDRTYTIILQDAKTGKEVGRVQDIQNISGGFDMSILRDALEASRPTQQGITRY